MGGKSPVHSLAVKLDWFGSVLGLSGRELGEAVVRFPSLLCYSITDNLEPKVEYLEIDLGFTMAEIRHITIKVCARWV